MNSPHNPAMRKRYLLILLSIFTFIPTILYSQNPVVLDEELSIQPVAQSPFESVKLSYNKQDETLYLLTQSGQIFSVDRGNGSLSELQSSSDHGLENVQGMDISTDGTFYIVGNERNEDDYTNVGIVKKATISDGEWSWSTLAQTAPYPLSNTDFDHIMNELVVGPNDEYVYINSGSRTDHGEEQAVWGSDNPWGGNNDIPEEGLYPGLREVPLTAVILRVPTDANDLLLENDHNFLHSNGYIFADGTRNSFGLAFDANGELFSADNAGERDDPGEFNWLQEGKHYGFPWRIGGNDTPQQFPDYDPDEDNLISTQSRDAIFNNDPDFPEKPDSIDFVEPILNYGPDADFYMDAETGEVMDASEQDTVISSFTAHRSALGLVFDADSALAGNYTGDPFVLAFTGGNDNSFLLSVMNDPGEDLAHLELTKEGDTYTMNTTIIANGFLNPIDSEIIDNKIYVLEFKNGWLNTESTTRIWEITFPGTFVNNEEEPELVDNFKLDQNYPNPFNPSTVISYRLPENSNVRLEVFDITGRQMATLVDGPQQSGPHQATFDASGLASGIYLYRLQAGEFVQTRQMVLVK